MKSILLFRPRSGPNRCFLVCLSLFHFHRITFGYLACLFITLYLSSPGSSSFIRVLSCLFYSYTLLNILCNVPKCQMQNNILKNFNKINNSKWILETKWMPVKAAFELSVWREKENLLIRLSYQLWYKMKVSAKAFRLDFSIYHWIVDFVLYFFFFYIMWTNLYVYSSLNSFLIRFHFFFFALLLLLLDIWLIK